MLKTLFGLTTLVLLLVLIGYATSGGPSDANLTDLGLTASAVRDPSGIWRLQFDLRYTGETPLVVYEGSLPWKNPRDLLLVACALNASDARLVPADTPVRDVPPNPLTLNPGDTLSGSVNLSARLPGLTEAVQASDIVLFWSHELKSADKQSLPRLNGGAVIPRQG
jgi:hypothetical protein